MKLQKPLLILCIVIATLQTEHSKGQSSINCLSGNCKDGQGAAIDDRGYYTGLFKNGKRDGHGILESKLIGIEEAIWLITEGDWKDDNKPEYDIAYYEKIVSEKRVPYSPVLFRKLYKNGSYDALVLMVDGTVKQVHGDKKGKEENVRIEDKVILQMYKDYISRKGPGTKSVKASLPLLGRLVKYRQKITVGRNVWVKLADFDFTPEERRHFIVFATSQLKHQAMPFGGQFIVQISDNHGIVVLESNNTAIFKPLGPGSYSCYVKFTQGFINATNSQLTDGFNATASIDSDDDYSGQNYALLGSSVNNESTPPVPTHTGCIDGDCKSGHGTYAYPSGNIYVGDFKQEARDGKGIFYFGNRDRFEGSFANNIQIHGSYYFANGYKYAGTYDTNGKELNGTYYSVDGNSMEVKDGKMVAQNTSPNFQGKPNITCPLCNGLGVLGVAGKGIKYNTYSTPNSYSIDPNGNSKVEVYGGSVVTETHDNGSFKDCPKCNGKGMIPNP